MPVSISVVVLTCNRPALLDGCLRALAAQTRPPLEVVLINNGAALSEPLPPLPCPVRVLAGTGRGGWAAARNRGVREAAGDWVAFTDDDCAPAPDWVEKLQGHAAAGRDCVGGLAEPAEPLPWPWWWHPEMAWCVGLSVPGLKTPLAGAVYYGQTANWATRRSVLLAEPFQEIPADFEGGAGIYQAGREDAELWRRLRQQGYGVHFDPALVVLHRISHDRLRARAVLRRAWLDGTALQRRQPSEALLDRAADSCLQLPADLLTGIWSGPEAPWREAAWKVVWAVRQAGQWAECRRRAGWVAALALFVRLGAARTAARVRGRARRTARRLLVGLWRLGRSRRTFPPRPRSVAVAAFGFLGDLVLLHPFLTGLKARRPELSLLLLTNPVGGQIYRHDPAIDHLLVLSGEDGRADAAAVRGALDRQRADLVLIPYCHGFPPSALFSRPAARVATFSEEVGFPLQWWYDRADCRITKPRSRPEAENLFRLFREAGFEGPLPRAPLAFLPEEVEEAAGQLDGWHLNRENLVIVSPGSGKAIKLWVEERWVEVVRYLRDEYRLRVVLVGSPAEEPLCRRIAAAAGEGVRVVCDSDLRQRALWLGAARLVVGTDNGVKHLAVAMDTPTLALYGPSDEAQWGPIRDAGRHGAVRACPRDLTEEELVGLSPNHAMERIGADRVRRALDVLLGER